MPESLLPSILPDYMQRRDAAHRSGTLRPSNETQMRAPTWREKYLINPRERVIEAVRNQPIGQVLGSLLPSFLNPVEQTANVLRGEEDALGMGDPSGIVGNIGQEAVTQFMRAGTRIPDKAAREVGTTNFVEGMEKIGLGGIARIMAERYPRLVAHARPGYAPRGAEGYRARVIPSRQTGPTELPSGGVANTLQPGYPMEFNKEIFHGLPGDTQLDDAFHELTHTAQVLGMGEDKFRKLYEAYVRIFGRGPSNPAERTADISGARNRFRTELEREGFSSRETERLARSQPALGLRSEGNIPSKFTGPVSMRRQTELMLSGGKDKYIRNRYPDSSIDMDTIDEYLIRTMPTPRKPVDERALAVARQDARNIGVDPFGYNTLEELQRAIRTKMEAGMSSIMPRKLP